MEETFSLTFVLLQPLCLIVFLFYLPLCIDWKVFLSARVWVPNQYIALPDDLNTPLFSQPSI